MDRWRRDLAKPEVPTGRDELPFLVISSLAIAVAAQLSDPGGAVDLLLLVPALLAFVARGLAPRMPAEAFAAAVVGSVVLVVGRHGDLELALFLLPIMVLYVAWHLGSMIRAGIILAVAVAAPWTIATFLVPEEGISPTPWMAANVFTFVLGRALYRQQVLIDALEEARSALAEQAVAEERRRIARDLHDLAGHTLAAVLLHVTGARHVLRRDIDEAERALVDAETVGRASLEQIRTTVSALRTHERGTDRALGGSADIAALIDDYRRAGLVIDATVPAPVTDLDGAVGIALHRIAREALTNVARHAPGNRVEFAIDLDAGEVRLVVADRGRPGTAPARSEGHFGLLGMRERARAIGGELEAGPTGDGWRVDARLPAQAPQP
ncbi:MAG TPA: sensor histidine kinase [Acidimicrobiales bacterium]|nr:sensor histidine kinase [Acidimicrobiales bacterium]